MSTHSSTHRADRSPEPCRDTDRPDADWPTADWVFDRYEAVRGRLPAASFPASSGRAENLAALAERFDVFLLDAFGVLNVGDAPIDGAPEAVADLAAAGKTLLVLTNGATLEAQDALAKYRAFGFDFAAAQIIASRDLLMARLRLTPAQTVWAVAGPARARVETLAPGAVRLAPSPALYAEADGFVLLSTDGWTRADNERLIEALQVRARPVLVGNPDVVSPRETGFKLEPGHYAHAVAERTGIEPEFFGKPFPNAYAEVRRRLAGLGLTAFDPTRVAMVGDTLHTDILGGAAAGFGSVLVNDHGLFRGIDPAPYIDRSGIVPDFIVATT